MKKTVLVFGLISGAIASLMMIGTAVFADRIGFDKGAYVGYTTMLLSMLPVYFGVRSYRDNASGGRITFGKAFAVGLGIMLISCLCYVATWEVLYFRFMPDFMDKYSAYEVQKLQASGATAAQVQAQMQQIQKSKEMYNNPLYNVAITFVEPLPVGLIVTLISAGLLRKREGTETVAPGVAAA